MRSLHPCISCLIVCYEPRDGNQFQQGCDTAAMDLIYGWFYLDTSTCNIYLICNECQLLAQPFHGCSIHVSEVVAPSAAFEITHPWCLINGRAGYMFSCISYDTT
jgi:hypothetical protein